MVISLISIILRSLKKKPNNNPATMAKYKEYLSKSNKK
jgi:hypothetical protein